MNNRFIKISALAISLLYVDLFCGAGGTSTGVELAQVHGEKCAKVIACVNHDENAIASHSANHPDSLHFTEDIRTLELSPLVDYAAKMRKEYPFAKLILWASLECTNFSKAKGGLARDADSRTLAEHLDRYIEALNPDSVQIENVEEFMSWGDLNEKGKPISRDKGRLYIKWVDHVRSYGYNFDWRLLNSADFGAFTSRKRFFAQFNKPGLPIVWPEQTHAKVTGKSGGLFENQFKPWNAVKDVLDLEDEGVSIFGRKKDLVEATLDRIYHGLIKFVAGGKDQWLLKYNSTSKNGKHNPPSIEDPCPVVSTQNRLGVATVDFITKYYSGRPAGKSITIEGPAGTITTVGNQALIQPKFLTAYYGNGFASSIETPSPTVTTGDRFNIINPKFMCSYNYKDEPKDLNNPCPTILTKDRFALVGTDFIDQQFGQSKPSSVDTVLGALTTNPKYAKVHTEWIMNTNFRNIGSSIHVPAPTITANRKWHYLMDAQYSRVGNSLDQPCFTLIARMDKTPPYLVDITQDASDLPDFIKVIDNVVVYEIYDNDSPMMKKIKEFMAHYGLKDIKMRMLKIQELKEIMGFPEDYTLIGTQAEQKKYIGNAVEVTMSKVLCEAIAYRLHNNRIAA
ncbi:DNA cytosine methyltransferase [Elizabethkingia sp. HX WHF]|uniref:DNA cytosine methyltransferase n=1 Tax=Elizabethkingia sp. HX WHF TaxID=3003190 RepID=UPI002A24963D|nr:DNA cytosine methyltransferase [Elizabethkingia sp. HX WHF]MDX8563452.1 DNA cytosine methyltransferase [Elizabethkingia sp. HX WHF]